MAAVAAPHASASTVSSPLDEQNPWNYAVPAQPGRTSPTKTNEAARQPLPQSTNGTSRQVTRPEPQGRMNTFGSGSARSTESGLLAPARIDALSRKDSSISESGSANDSLLDLYGPNRSAISSMDYGERSGQSGDMYDENDPEHSRWIHRDKLARIESEELQAAGFILPRVRATSKSSRRERSRDYQGNGSRSEQTGQKRLRADETPPIEDSAHESSGWDLRMPEEAADDGYQDISGGVKGVSRIPVLKTSPLPIAMEQLERDTPIRRKMSNGWAADDESISYSKSRGRSESIKALDDTSAHTTPTPGKRMVSDNSPTKKAAARKGSVPGTRAASASQRPKTRSGPGPATNTSARPPTRSGEKRPEGDPPWLATMYKPDPRLPPDQQLLPTVAKRLQQEQWEKEGKFGNAYDTEFRPINDLEFRQPEPSAQNIEMEEQKPEEDAEWPLRAPKSPALSSSRPGTAGGYSTMPKITTGQAGVPQGIPRSPRPHVQIQEPPEEPKKKGGCGCCVVM